VATQPNFVRLGGERYLYYSEDFIPGGTLDSVKLPLRGDEVKSLLLGLVDGLQYLEERGVIHRDIKPGNIGLTDEWEPVLLDFGVALEGDDDITGFMDVAPGTPAYAAPEQFSPRRLVTLDHRADQHALGVVAKKLLTGRTQPTTERLSRSVEADCLREIIERLTATRPNQRFRHSAMLRRALEDCDV